MQIRELNEIKDLKLDSNYVVLRFNGLFGDVLHGMCRLYYILQKYPGLPWIILQDYPDKERVKDASELFKIWIDNKQIKYYFYNANGQAGRIRPETIKILRDAGIDDRKILDCYVFQRKCKHFGLPAVGVNIPNIKEKNKAVIFRYSGYHGHYFNRNRPLEEWIKIEKCLMDFGYNVYLLGKDDNMPNPNNLIDLRNKFTVREVLEFSSNAQICISVTTFLYVWTQFICPTLILSERGDIPALNSYWKLTDNLEICDIDNPNYFQQIFEFIERMKNI